MESKKTNLSERFLDYAADIIKLLGGLNRTAVGRHIANQLMRSSTSSASNYEEACGAESKADFIHKMQLVLKELRESLFWLKLVNRAGLVPDEYLQPSLTETEELAKIIAKSILTARGKKGKS